MRLKETEKEGWEGGLGREERREENLEEYEEKKTEFRKVYEFLNSKEFSVHGDIAL
ncbi:hypothetical protein T11_310 [Trichinella zimbabwensis]|uniref:Uncharacterized protein n=1 Tax=Trichinella zimbabwensis TaxID=268475 RepID=A0A0V1GS01_9BILA|nr:hypothetical protein T11_310 [Trichinella zimbabwensis]